jgi:hypothetical protein
MEEEFEFVDTEDIVDDIVDDITVDKQSAGNKNKEIEFESLEDEVVDFADMDSDVDIEAPHTEAKGEEFDKNDSSPKKSLYLNLAKALSEGGVISKFEDSEFEDNDDGESILKSLMQKTVNESINEYKSQFSESTVKILEAIEKGVPIDDFLAAKNSELKYSSINEGDLDDDKLESTRVKILTDYYKGTTKFSDDRIAKEVKRIVDLGDDVDESKLALKELKIMEKEKADSILESNIKNSEDSKNKYIESITKLKSEVDEIDLDFLGIPKTKRSRTKLYDILTKPIDLPDGTKTNGVHKKRQDIGAQKFDIILAALIDKGVFDGSLDSISSKQREGAISDLQRAVEEMQEFSSGGVNRNRSKSSGADEIFYKQRY